MNKAHTADLSQRMGTKKAQAQSP